MLPSLSSEQGVAVYMRNAAQSASLGEVRNANIDVCSSGKQYTQAARRGRAWLRFVRRCGVVLAAEWA